MTLIDLIRWGQAQIDAGVPPETPVVIQYSDQGRFRRASFVTSKLLGPTPGGTYFRSCDNEGTTVVVVD
jgi:hypothetical protein